ncbi:MAG: type II toxin-antitoxin system VapC family toxin [Candidatus Freyarchaeota archaeon]|nr:type II toxin-antitoxin system VapC family toxin [Candidatus Jordarchaeia archaeon]MBS7270475.1 type II toxin-antitoxin system VapC family toxin [Candidatus Jordarchaeia archaeon]MBS7280558.1 type II toxin-antitoxin system VapC family toxin [Candidatus Jordarchaeia archaeon]
MANTNSRKFLDSSVYLHAYLKVKRRLTEKELEVKQRAATILERIEAGEPVVTSVVHLSEVLNIIEARLGVQKSQHILETILSMDNISILNVSRRDYEEALGLAVRYTVSPNDALAAALCRMEKIKEVYSFDKHFENIPWLRRVT